jgi:hypothetical protein
MQHGAEIKDQLIIESVREDEGLFSPVFLASQVMGRYQLLSSQAEGLVFIIAASDSSLDTRQIIQLQNLLQNLRQRLRSPRNTLLHDSTAA